MEPGMMMCITTEARCRNDRGLVGTLYGSERKLLTATRDEKMRKTQYLHITLENIISDGDLEASS